MAVRKIDKEIRKINNQIYSMRYYYKTNYGIENLGLQTITGVKDKTLKELRAILKETKQQVSSVKTAIKQERPQIRQLARVQLSPDVSLTRAEYNAYIKSMTKENLRRKDVTEQAFKYMTKVGRNPWKSPEQFQKESGLMDIVELKLNVQGHTQESFNKFMQRRMELWEDSSKRTDQYRINFNTALDRSDLPLETANKMRALLNSLTDAQISYLAVGEFLFQEVFNYEYESVSVYKEQYEELYDRIMRGFVNA